MFPIQVLTHGGAAGARSAAAIARVTPGVYTVLARWLPDGLARLLRLAPSRTASGELVEVPYDLLGKL